MLYISDCIRFLTLKILTNSFMVNILVTSHFCHYTQLQRIYLYNIISHIYQWNKYLEIYSKAAPRIYTEYQAGDSHSGLQMIKLHAQVA